MPLSDRLDQIWSSFGDKKVISSISTGKNSLVKGKNGKKSETSKMDLSNNRVNNSSIFSLNCPICSNSLRKYDFKTLGLHIRRIHQNVNISDVNTKGINGFISCQNCKSLHHTSLRCDFIPNISNPLEPNLNAADLDYAEIYCKSSHSVVNSCENLTNPTSIPSSLPHTSSVLMADIKKPTIITGRDTPPIQIKCEPVQFDIPLRH